MTASDVTPSVPARSEPATLSWLSFGAALLGLLGVFVFLNPIWKQNDMNAWNENIWWSYLPIPLVVLGLLKLERKLSWPALGFETMKLAFVKFVLTYTIASVLWEWRGVPGTGIVPQPEVTDTSMDHFEVQAAPTATVIAPQELGTLAGTVLDADGSAAANVLVYVRSGLEGLTFEAPLEPVVLGNDGSGFGPTRGVIQAHQVVRLQSSDAALHTAIFSDLDPLTERRHRLLNYPVIPHGERQIMFERGYGWLGLACSVHEEAEPSCEVLVLDHPFWTRTDQEGAFMLRGVPAGNLQVEAWISPQHNVRSDVQLSPAGTATLALSIGDQAGGS